MTVTSGIRYGNTSDEEMGHALSVMKTYNLLSNRTADPKYDHNGISDFIYESMIDL